MILDIKEIVMHSKSIAEEHNIEEKMVHSIIEQAVASAWRRDHGERDQNVRAVLNLHKGIVDVYVAYEVVEKVEDDQIQISLDEALKINAESKIDQTVEKKYSVENLGRIAAQTAKQVMLQKLREIDREIMFNEYKDKIGTIMTATVVKVDPKVVRLEIGRIKGIMPISEQIPQETYKIHDRIKVLLKEIEQTGREPKLILNRSSADFLRLLFETEVPEMKNGAVAIKAIVREAGSRTKIAVTSQIPNIDPVGTLIGGKGVRVQTVNNEIGHQEKIDIVVWDDDPKQNIINALSSTEVVSISILEKATNDQIGKARVVVDKDQLSVAIGKSGHNVRLAGKLTGYDIDIVDEADATTTKTVKPKFQKKEELEEGLLKAVEEVHQEDEPSTET